MIGFTGCALSCLCFVIHTGVGPCDGHSRDNLSAISSQCTDMLRLRCDLSSGRAICVANGGLVGKNEMSVAMRKQARGRTDSIVLGFPAMDGQTMGNRKSEHVGVVN